MSIIHFSSVLDVTSIESILTLTAGADVSQSREGFVASGETITAFGSVDPTTVFSGEYTTKRIYNYNVPPESFQVKFSPINIPDADSSWKTVEITGTFQGGTNPRTISYDRVNRDIYTASSSGGTTWVFNTGISADDNMVDTNEYTVKFIRG